MMTASVTAKTISVPAEWAPQKAIWTAWPADAGEWNHDIAAPRRDVAALITALSAAGNKVRLLASGTEAEASARAAVGAHAEVIAAKYGDIWLRDTGPIFASAGGKGIAGAERDVPGAERDVPGAERDVPGAERDVALRFKTNSWGGKYHLPDDSTVGDDVARLAGKPVRRFDFVLEGGAVDQDGQGTILTTRQTLLNPNRNGWTQTAAETALRTCFGARKIIWIDEGLMGDHTDGHIDNIARFVAPGRVVCQAPANADDPNAQTLNHIARTLEAATDATGRKLDVIRIPGAGLYHNVLGEISPASHMNFVIANGVVVVPVYGTPTQEAALKSLQAVFPDRRVVGVPSQGLLGCGAAGGGSFHCITQQEPL